MTWKLTIALIVAILIAAATVQRGYVATLDDYEDSRPGNLQRIADGGAVAAAGGVPALRGYATGLAKTGFRVRGLIDDETAVDGVPGAGFVASLRAESSATLPTGDDVLVVVNPIAGTGGPSGPNVSTLRDRLAESLWAGAGIGLLACLGLLVVKLLAGRSGRGRAHDEEPDDEARNGANQRAKRSAVRAE